MYVEDSSRKNSETFLSEKQAIVIFNLETGKIITVFKINKYVSNDNES